MKEVKHTVMASKVITAWIKAIIDLLYKLHLILNSREDGSTMCYTTQKLCVFIVPQLFILVLDC